jgi:signal transduction histidine kinase
MRENVARPQLDAIVRRAGDTSSARVTLLGVTSGTEGVQTYVSSDSFDADSIEDLRFDVGRDAARSGRPTQGTESGQSGRVAQAARPLFFTRATDARRVVGAVVVLSAPVRGVSGYAEVVRTRIIVAGLVALLAALIAGSLVAERLSRRIARLRVAANRVARGDFDARFPAGRDDELGRLAIALDDMRRQLAELDDARKGFIAKASHELRTPIFSLGGFLELLQDEDLDADTRDRFLTQVREQVDRLQRLAVDLLDLSKLEAGGLELRREQTDVGMLARSVAAEFEPRLAVHDSRVEVRLPPAPVEVVTDPERTAQVVRALIDNALTHTPDGTDVVVSVAERAGPPARVTVGVRDFGPGIQRTVLPHVFEPFFTSDGVQGSGLGLAIASELAARMDGELRVESQPGRTTFTLELPR